MPQLIVHIVSDILIENRGILMRDDEMPFETFLQYLPMRWTNWASDFVFVIVEWIYKSSFVKQMIDPFRRSDKNTENSRINLTMMQSNLCALV